MTAAFGVIAWFRGVILSCDLLLVIDCRDLAGSGPAARCEAARLSRMSAFGTAAYLSGSRGVKDGIWL